MITAELMKRVGTVLGKPTKDGFSTTVTPTKDGPVVMGWWHQSF